MKQGVCQHCVLQGGVQHVIRKPKRRVNSALRCTPPPYDSVQNPSNAASNALTSAGSSEMIRAPGLAKSRVLAVLQEDSDPFYTLNEKLKPEVRDLLMENPSTRPGPDSVVKGQGEWQVFHAPHIVGLSSNMGAKFNPIRYRLDGDRLQSNVKYSHPLFGSGWLSASGSFKAKNDSTVIVNFDKFWVDVGASNLRQELQADEGKIDAMGMIMRGEFLQNADGVVSMVGRAAFFPQLAEFPVQYLDDDIAVFKFPPLNSSIAVRKVQD